MPIFVCFRLWGVYKEDRGGPRVVIFMGLLGVILGCILVFKLGGGRILFL